MVCDSNDSMIIPTLTCVLFPLNRDFLLHVRGSSCSRFLVSSNENNRTLLILNVLTLASAALKLKNIYSSITLALDLVETRSLPVMESGNGLESLR